MLEILLPFASAYLYRLDGKNAISRAAWVGGMFLIGAFATFDYVTATAFAVFSILAKMPPTNTTFSVVSWSIYGRKDSKKWRWMQFIAEEIGYRWRDSRKQGDNKMDVTDMWHKIGGIHGTMRPIFTIIPIAFMIWFSGDWKYLTGLFVFASGFIYYWCGKQQHRYSMSYNYGWVMAEAIIGMLLCLIVLSWK